MANLEGLEEVCARCSLQPLEVSLVLICNHRLCLRCARDQLQVSRETTQLRSVATCPSCGSVTEVEAGAAQQIQSLTNSVSRVSPAPAPLSAPSVASVGWSPSSDADLQRKARPERREQIEQSPAPTTLLPRPRSPPTSLELQEPPEAECGQCEVKIADLRCLQCDERFCRSCYTKMHKVGRMREHRSLPLSGITRATELCDAHREPLHFFCLECTECICAECVVQRDRPHHGHDVVTAKTAFNQLSGTIQQLLETSGTRLRQKSASKDLMQQLEGVTSKGKQDLKRAFLRLQEDLKLKEQNLMGEETGRVADQALLAKAKQCEARSREINRLREWMDMLRDGEASNMSVFIKVNLYMSVKQGLAGLLSQTASLLDALSSILVVSPIQDILRIQIPVWVAACLCAHVDNGSFWAFWEVHV